MSRTHNTKPRKFKSPKWEEYYEKVPYIHEYISLRDGKKHSFEHYVWMPIAGVKPKLKRHVNSDRYWRGGVPSDFVNLYANRPFRHKARIECQAVLKAVDYEEIDILNTQADIGWWYW